MARDYGNRLPEHGAMEPSLVPPRTKMRRSLNANDTVIARRSVSAVVWRGEIFLEMRNGSHTDERGRDRQRLCECERSSGIGAKAGKCGVNRRRQSMCKLRLHQSGAGNDRY